MLVPPSSKYEPPDESHEKKIIEQFEKTLDVPKPSVREYFPPKDLRKGFDPRVRAKRQFDQLVAFTQKVWRDSEDGRAARFRQS